MNTDSIIKEADSLLLFPQDCVYTKCYCEENVWKLCDHIRLHNNPQLEHTYAVFISNSGRQVPLWQQNAGVTPPNFGIVWDYHVILVHQNVSRKQCCVYDLDSRLSFPCNFEQYAEEVIGDDEALEPHYRRFFRVISASEYLRTFASDRSHMSKQDGSWSSTPPDYPCIRTTDCTNNIQDFISMDPDVGYGKVLDCRTFINTFNRNSF